MVVTSSGHRCTCVCTLLLAGGDLADVDCVRGPVAVRLHLWRARVGRRIGAGVGVEDLLDLGIGQVGEFEAQPGNQVIERDDGRRHEERALVGVVLSSY